MRVDFKKIQNKIALLAMVTFLTLLGLNVLCPPAIDKASAADYTDAGYTMALSTSFFDAYTIANKTINDPNTANNEQTEAQDTLVENAKKFTDEHFANIGLLIGQRVPSSNSGSFATAQQPLSLTKAQIASGYPFNTDAARKYISLGQGLQNMSAKGKKVDSSSARLGESLDSLSDTGRSLTNAGVTLLKKYNPAPVLLVLFDNQKYSPANYPENILLNDVIMSNPNVKEVVLFFGGPSGLIPGIPFSVVLVATIVMMLVVTSVLMTLINGRAAGENIRKAMVKIVVASIGLPLVANGLTWGVDFIGTISGGSENYADSQMVEKHLLMKDWYDVGFKIPEGVLISITDGQMSIPLDGVRKINEYVYYQATGATPTDELITKRIKSQSKDGNTSTIAITAAMTYDKKPYATDKLFKAAEDMSESKDVDVEGIGHIGNASIKMEGSNGNYTLSNGNNYGWGMVPIAAYNLMNTNFSASGMTMYSIGQSATIPTVAFNAGQITSTASMPMPSLIRFIATYSILMAAMKGLFTIFANGFGGIASGGVKTTLGNSAGFGQLVGGAIAVVGGVFGIGLIMSVSLELLNAIYNLTGTLFSSSGDASVLEPLRELAPDIPIIGGLIADMITGVASFVLSIIMAFMLPKFGGIPVTAFCQKMAGLPDSFAERAQQIENRFTGDFRAGSGGSGSGGMANAMAGLGANAGAQKDALKMGAAAVGGYALSKIGSKINDKYKDGDSASMADTGKDEDAKTDGTSSTDDAPNTETENTTENSAVSDNDAISEKDGNDSINDVQNNSESESESNNDSLQDNDTLQDSVNESDSIAETVSESDAMSETDSSQESLADIDKNTESIANNISDSKSTSQSEHSSTAQGGTSTSNSTSTTAKDKSGLNPNAQGANGASSMANKDTGAKDADVKLPTGTAIVGPTKASRHDKIMRGIGKGLMAAGGETTGRQAIAGVVHMAGGAVGAQNATGRILNRETDATQRKRDDERRAQQQKNSPTQKNMTIKSKELAAQEAQQRDYDNHEQENRRRQQRAQRQRNTYDPRDE